MTVRETIALDDCRETKVRQIDGSVPIEVLAEARGTTPRCLHTPLPCGTLGCQGSRVRASNIGWPTQILRQLTCCHEQEESEPP
jgi:hypothetical protein